MTRYRFCAIALMVLFGAGLVAGVALDRWLTRPVVPSSVVTQGNATVATIPTPALKPKDVIKLVTDPATAAKLTAALRDVQTLTETVAELRAQGSGPAQYVDRPVPGADRIIHEVHFGDWRLKFDATDASGTPIATYSLTQKVETVLALGKDEAGKTTAAVQVLEVGPGDTRTPMPSTTRVIVADQTSSRWRVRLAIQAGVAGVVTSTRAGQAGAVVAAPWLRRGSSRAAEDNRLALLTPAVFISTGSADPALLPVSVNLRFGPVRDLWLSPVVAAHITPNGASGFRFGAALTATF